MNPSARREKPEQGRGQPFVPLFSGRRVLVVVFNQPRGMSLIRSGAEAPMGFWRTMTRAGCQCEDMGTWPTRVTQAIEKHRFGEKIKEKTNGPIYSLLASHSLFRIAIMMRSVRVPSAKR